tara:strand:+ start:1126 stop:1905 length:780 start_codon:yes stop_codon:yes gene_type:complete
MNLALQLRRGISAEIFKYKKTFTLWLLILAPAFVPIINFIILWRRGPEMIKEGMNAWSTLISFSIDPANFLFPFFVMMVALLVNNIEYSSNTWKLIYAQPLSRLALYLSKMKVFIVMIFISLMLFGTFTILVGLSMRVVQPGLGFEESFSFGFEYALMFKIFLATLGMASIQFFISQQSKNLILPLGIGIAGLISFMIVSQGWEYAPYHPYGYAILATGGIRQEGYQIWADMASVYKSLIVATGVFVAAGVIQVKKRIM